MALACGEEMGGEGTGGPGAGAAGDGRKAWIEESSGEWEERESRGSSVAGREAGQGASAVQPNPALGQDPRAHLPPNRLSCQVLVETQKQGYGPFSPFKTTDI